MNDKGCIAPYLASSLVNLFKPENKSQVKLTKDHNSIALNDFLINDGVPVTFFSNMLTFRDKINSFKLNGDPLETMTIYDFNVSSCKPQDRKLIYEFGKESNFNIGKEGRKSPRDPSLIKLIKSPAIMGISAQYFYDLILWNFVVS